MKSGNNVKKQMILLHESLLGKKRRFRLLTRYHLNIMTPDETIAYIQNHHCSIARLGDGEFNQIFDRRDINFQIREKNLSDELKRTLCNTNGNLLLCVPRCLNTLTGCKEEAKKFWLDWGRGGFHEEVVNLLWSTSGKNYLFGDAQITRPYFDWRSSKRAERIFPKLRQLWEDKDIMIVEGDQTRLGVGNDLFDNARTIKRILCPAVNAFERREEIRETTVELYKSELILMALGPTATVLASDFADLGMQALDIGHIDIEYEWYLRGTTEKIAIPGKYTNEAHDDKALIYTECNDDIYQSQIIARIGC